MSDVVIGAAAHHDARPCVSVCASQTLEELAEEGAKAEDVYYVHLINVPLQRRAPVDNLRFLQALDAVGKISSDDRTGVVSTKELETKIGDDDNAHSLVSELQAELESARKKIEALEKQRSIQSPAIGKKKATATAKAEVDAEAAAEAEVIEVAESPSAAAATTAAVEVEVDAEVAESPSAAAAAAVDAEAAASTSAVRKRKLNHGDTQRRTKSNLKNWKYSTGVWEEAVDTEEESFPRPKGRAPKGNNGQPKKWNYSKGGWEEQQVAAGL